MPRYVRMAGSFLALSALFVLAPGQQADGAGRRTLYLVRHGQYDHEDPADPHVGKHLIPLGVAQARLVAARLAALPVRMTSLTSSTLARAIETARVLGEDFPGLELVHSELLSECVPPTWRTRAVEEVTPEELAECENQLEEAFSHFFVPSPSGERHDIVVCHGNVIRYLVTKALHVDTMAWLEMTTANCGLTVVRIEPDATMKVLAFNDVGHIPANLQTGLGAKERALLVPE